jgi:hypothetical protein
VKLKNFAVATKGPTSLYNTPLVDAIPKILENDFPSIPDEQREFRSQYNSGLDRKANGKPLKSLSSMPNLRLTIRIQCCLAVGAKYFEAAFLPSINIGTAF